MLDISQLEEQIGGGRYNLIHRTRYVYEGAVTVSHRLARLAPRFLPGQRSPWHVL